MYAIIGVNFEQSCIRPNHFHFRLQRKAKVDVLVKLSLAKSYIGLGQDEFEKFVACSKCCTLYKTEDCVVRKSNGRTVSKTCGHVRFPNHSQRSRRTQYGALLMKNMR